MTMLSVGDLAQAYTMRRQTSELKTALIRLSTEATTGLTADLSRSVRGDFATMADIEARLTKLDGYKSVTDEAASFTAAMQNVFDSISDLTSSASAGLVQASSSANSSVIRNAGADAFQRLSSVVLLLNTRFGDRSLLSGIDTNVSAVASAEDLMAALVTATADDASALAIEETVSEWFDSNSGFGAVGYLGSTTSLAPFQIGEGESTKVEIKANDPRIRESLIGFALAALIGKGLPNGNDAELIALAKRAGERLFEAGTGLAYARGEVGSIQARIDESAIRNGAEAAILEIAKANLVGIDPYEAASALEATQNQLEAVYTITARLSRLSLADMLR